MTLPSTSTSASSLTIPTSSTSVLCCFSGIQFSVQYLPLNLSSRESHHPVFDLLPSKLLKLTERWVEGELAPVESYILYVALLKSTGRIRFQVPATYHAPISDAVVASYLPRLVRMVEIIQSIGEEKVNSILNLPCIVISPDTKDLAGSGDWLSIWESAYKDYQDNYRTSTQLERIERKEINLERYIRDRTKDITTYSSQLADWAALAGNFPEWDAGLDIIKITGKQMSLSSYWRFIIKSCAAGESIWSIPVDDIKELIEHCEDHIPQGSIFSHTLMSLLRSGLTSVSNFFNLGDIDLSRNGSKGFQILSPETSVEDANKLAIIESAPLHAPVESAYPTKLAYIRAKQAWNLKCEYERERKEVTSSGTASLLSRL